MLAKFILFGIIGTFTSLVITSAKRSIESKSLQLTGEASLALFPFFGLAGFLFPVISIQIGKLPWYGRGAIFMAAFYVVQLVAGFILTKLNVCPWSYSSKWSLFGLIRLADAPLWFALGLALEWLYPYAKAFGQLMG